MNDKDLDELLNSIMYQYDQPAEIPGGHRVKEYYNCSQLSFDQLSILAERVKEHPRFSEIDRFVALGMRGAIFAAAINSGRAVTLLNQYGEIHGPVVAGKKVACVSDVCLTGSNFRKGISELEELGAEVVLAICLIDRSCDPNILGDLPLASVKQIPFE